MWAACRNGKTKHAPSVSRSSRVSQSLRFPFSCALTEDNTKDVLLVTSFNMMIPASLIFRRDGNPSGDLADTASDKTWILACPATVRRAVRKADLDMCMAGRQD